MLIMLGFVARTVESLKECWEAWSRPLGWARNKKNTPSRLPVLARSYQTALFIATNSTNKITVHVVPVNWKESELINKKVMNKINMGHSNSWPIEALNYAFSRLWAASGKNSLIVSSYKLLAKWYPTSHVSLPLISMIKLF